MNGISGISYRETPYGLEVHVHRSAKKKTSKLMRKRLPYNFKQMSKQISQAKTSTAARPLVAKMRAKLSWLYKKMRSDEYNETEIMAAIIHAAAMERIAKRKVRHLEEEEEAERGEGFAGELPDNVKEDKNNEIYGKDELKKSMEENEELSEEMMKRMMEEIEELERELTEDSLSELQDMLSYSSGDMSEEDIKELKRKHRSDEEKQLTRADLKYLKMMFEKLEQEKRQAQSVYGGDNSDNSGYFSSDISGVDLAVAYMQEMDFADINVGEFIDMKG